MKIIINADDFGFTKSVNEAVFTLAKRGTLTSTTVMVNMPYWEEVDRLLEHPNFGIGLHFNITQGKPILDASEISTIVNSETGEFYEFKELRKRSKQGKINVNDVYKELKAQILLLKQRVGDRLTHMDSHQGVHKYKPISNAFLSLGKENIVLGLRSPHHLFITDAIVPEVVGIKNIFKFGIKRYITELYYRKYNVAFRKYYVMPEGELLNINLKKVDTFEALEKLIALEKLYIEIPCHPATSITDLPKTKLTDKRLQEFEILKSESFKNSLNKFQLISFKDLKK
jgi:predicted glycoside hydrolase/deacetylase ChbG (UPF0249 family)